MTAACGSVSWLERQWYRTGPWQLALLPFSFLFQVLSALRRGAYRLGWLNIQRLSVPVIVVGNLTVGGSGKTPLVLWLARWLRHRGFHPGIVSRGYGGHALMPRPAIPEGDAASLGDEPLLLARESGCPVWVGRDRAAAGRALLLAHPACDVIISDDGLQHYRLARDVEIAVVDGERLLGNGRLLPAGPLREGAWRLRRVDAVVMNGGSPDGMQFGMRLCGTVARNLKSGATAELATFRGMALHALAGIGHPQRFFDHLQRHGLNFTAHPFPDHHPYRQTELDWPDAEAILMTEKDAVKCAAFADGRYWSLPVEAELDAGFGEKILALLRKHDGRETA